jgi:pSer/pThr/pTyr-binding forkhead associated (FHA) protein
VNGAFRLADEGSTAGTWVNYTPVSHEGTRLEHGDLIHFGRVGYRFMLKEPRRAQTGRKTGEPAA